jgi:CHASE3 domain sensor protein
MTANHKARLAFTSAIALLFVSGVAALFTFSDLKGDEHWVAHTHAVQDAIADVETADARMSRARLGYVLSGNQNFLLDYEANAALVNARIQKLKELTKDNPTEQANCNRLEELTKQRVRLWEDSIRLGRDNRPHEPGQGTLTAHSFSLADQMTTVTQAMREAEQRLLIERRKAADRLLTVLIAIVITAFSLALLLFFIHYRLLIAELRAREMAEQTAKQAEQLARKSEEASRRLSGRLLQLQDEERRRFARELHDSLGQYLVSL